MTFVFNRNLKILTLCIDKELAVENEKAYKEIQELEKEIKENNEAIKECL